MNMREYAEKNRIAYLNVDGREVIGSPSLAYELAIAYVYDDFPCFHHVVLENWENGEIMEWERRMEEEEEILFPSAN